MKEILDLAIVGMGFAGYTGAIYSTRYGLKTVIIGEVFGGQTAEAHDIGNYPGFESITGMELMQKVQAQAINLGAQEVYDRVVSIKDISHTTDEKKTFELTLQSGDTLFAHNVLLTIGMTRRKLGVPGEQELYGKGVTYCATCDGYFFKNKKVAVIGGGDSAVSAALYLADICTEVHILARKNALRAEQFWIDKLHRTKNIIVHYNTAVSSFEGTDHLEKINLTGDESELTVDGAFIEVGHEPYKAFTDAIGVETDEEGYITVNPEQMTTLPGVYAAGDSTAASNKFAQLLTAAAEAAIAAESIARNNK